MHIGEEAIIKQKKKTKLFMHSGQDLVPNISKQLPCHHQTFVVVEVKAGALATVQLSPGAKAVGDDSLPVSSVLFRAASVVAEADNIRMAI